MMLSATHDLEGLQQTGALSSFEMRTVHFVALAAGYMMARSVSAQCGLL